MDPDPDPAIFVTGLQGASTDKNHKERTKHYQGFSYYLFLMIEGSRARSDPEPENLLLVDPDPGGRIRNNVLSH